MSDRSYPYAKGPFTAEVRAARSRVGVVARQGTPAQLAEARRDYRAARLAAHIEAVVADAPPLTPAQRDRLAALLRPKADVRDA